MSGWERDGSDHGACSCLCFSFPGSPLSDPICDPLNRFPPQARPIALRIAFRPRHRAGRSRSLTTVPTRPLSSLRRDKFWITTASPRRQC